ncbi:hypothetical protein ACVWZR_005325 [Bradyrhizobium sp. i1.3.1]
MTVGGQIGYRWQIGHIVLGVEGQGNWADLSGSNVSIPFSDVNQSKIDLFGLMTGQIGYAFDNVLFYAKGGAAVASNTYRVNSALTGAQIASTDSSPWGATVGAGIEFGFARNWSVSVEYDHLFMRGADVNFVTPAGSLGGDRIRQDFDLMTARLNYKFGGPIQRSAISSRSINERYRPEDNLLPTGCDNPASSAASSLLSPAAIAAKIYSVHCAYNRGPSWPWQWGSSRPRRSAHYNVHRNLETPSVATTV